ncbi:hypothetical protein FOG51_02467 [Hanseniaspora uvarum]|uniref:Uncharacterized protein n=1 Tax=Hanseniaspora uvarum TaxID=29833 RepID=A0A1E5S198_HANUV|nr:hypothetical protein FOG48_02178 [Hanseniaspora uvarum]KAF0272743.1 hypothetical protein FOG51_02467 [Hanseniaspora uvarum]OEJ92795.1 hypothetical protein AWRI3580_g549 [Hanseniaspora uvarum]
MDDHNDNKETMIMFLQNFIDDRDTPNLFNILDDLIAHNSSNKLTLDFSISIDDDGNSTLHWLSNLCLIDVILDILRIHKSDNFNDENLFMKYSQNLKIIIDFKVLNNYQETCLCQCIKSRNSYITKSFNKMLDIYQDLIDFKNEQNQTILHILSENYLQEASEYYLETILAFSKSKFDTEYYNQWINTKDYKTGNTILHTSSINSNFDLIKILLKYGADPYVTNNEYTRSLDYGIGELSFNNKNPSLKLLEDELFNINQIYEQDNKNYKEDIVNLESNLEAKRLENNKLEEIIYQNDLVKNLDNLKTYNFLNDGLMKQKEILKSQFDSFPEFETFIKNFMSQKDNKDFMIPLISQDLLRYVDDGIGDNLNQKLVNELDELSVEQLDTMIETYKSQNNSLANLLTNMHNQRSLELNKYRELIAKSLDMSLDDPDEIDRLIKNMSASIDSS